MPSEDINPWMLGRVLHSSHCRQQVDVGAVRAQLVTDQRGTCLVIGARRINGRDAHQPRGEVDDLIARAIDFG